jgi:CO/xanthine dehydrogenase Mo-binding subunit
MPKIALKVSRRQFLGTGGALIVSFAWSTLASATTAPERANVVAHGVPLDAVLEPQSAPWPATLPPNQLDSWIAVTQDGDVIASVGKIEAGMGISTAFAQIVAEELDVPLSRVTVNMGDTATTVDQRGTGGSNGIEDGGKALRHAGARARQALVRMAAQHLQTDEAQLTVRDGVVQSKSDAVKHVSYGELVGGEQFHVTVDEHVPLKDPATYSVVGQPVPRMDIPAKARGEYHYLVDLKLPGMLHGRVIRPPQAGAQLVEVPRGQSFPGLVAVVTQGNFVGVVCEREEQAIRVSRDLQIKWTEPAAAFDPDYDALYARLRNESAVVSKTAQNMGDVDAAMAGAHTKLAADYDFPFHSHASMGPGCAVADVNAERAVIWAAGQKPYPLRRALAQIANMPLEKVRVTWMPGPGSYGMNDADDAAMDAMLLSKAVGHPVRVQYMRADAVGWDPKGSPTSFRMQGALDRDGKVVAFSYLARGYSSLIRPAGTEVAGDTLSAQLIGGFRNSGAQAFQLADEHYQFDNKRRRSDLLDWERSLSTGLRTAHLRDPDGMATCFASECFIDELAAAAKADPVEFRLRYLKDERDKGVIRAAAEKAGWQSRPSPRPAQSGNVVTGRGIAYAPRGKTTVALVAEIEVYRDTGQFHVTRFVVAHDCGYVINPRNLTGTIEANLMMGMSRAKYESVRFDSHRVASVDWLTYPIAEIADVPNAVEIVMVNNHPDHPSSGAGEPASRPMAAALSNALFDATGIRFRRVPFSAEVLKAAFDRQGAMA